MSITIRSPINIAIIKYWGKKDVEKNYALNDSISCCLEMIDDENSSLKIYTDTTISISLEKEDILSINGQIRPFDGRHKKVLRIIREKYNDIPPLLISSINYFPTAAGLASSASGMSALVRGIFELFRIMDSKFECDCARIASGSACRSLKDGWVLWSSLDNLPHSLWGRGEKMSDLRCMIFITESQEKKISSKQGMQFSLETSTFLAEKVLKNSSRVDELKDILLREDYESLFRLMMIESDELHYICSEDTKPPLLYLNEKSKNIIRIIKEEINSSSLMIAAYTFDAGPNAFIFCKERHVSFVKGKIEESGGIENIIYCRIGNGARVLNK